MNYYPHHLGDYAQATSHLSILEDGAYRRLLDRYYTTEAPLINDEAALLRVLRARSDEEKAAVRNMLEEFFTPGPDGWTHKRCDAEISKFHSKASKAADAANKRWSKAGKKPEDGAQCGQSAGGQNPHCVNDANALPTQCQPEPEPEPEPRTKNPTPTQPTLSEDRAGGATAVELSIALRGQGVQSQPADPRLVALAGQGVAVEAVVAACLEAKKSKPSGAVNLGYVVGILQRWSAEAAAISVAGAMPPARASPVGRETAKDRSRRETLEGLTGTGQRGNGRQHEFIDITPAA